MELKERFLGFLICLTVCFVFVSCGGAPAIQVDPFLTDVTVAEARAIIEDNEGNENFIIIDVRTPGEYNSGHIENAINVNYYDNFEANIGTFDRNKTYLVYCGAGGRSRNAVNKMYNEMGFSKIYHMYQGYSSW